MNIRMAAIQYWVGGHVSSGVRMLIVVLLLDGSFVIRRLSVTRQHGSGIREIYIEVRL